MSSRGDRQGTEGLARAIDALFEDGDDDGDVGKPPEADPEKAEGAREPAGTAEDPPEAADEQGEDVEPAVAAVSAEAPAPAESPEPAPAAESAEAPEPAEAAAKPAGAVAKPAEAVAKPAEAAAKPAEAAAKPAEAAAKPAEAPPKAADVAMPAADAGEAPPASPKPLDRPAKPAEAPPKAAQAADAAAKPAKAKPKTAKVISAAAKPTGTPPKAVPVAEPAGKTAQAPPKAAKVVEPAGTAAKPPEPAQAAKAPPQPAEPSTAPPEPAQPEAAPEPAQTPAPAAKAAPAASEPAAEAGKKSPESSDGATPQDVEWEEVKEPDPSADADADADPGALAEAVEDFLKSDPMSRDGKGRELREQAMALRAAHAIDPLAQAVERLALEAGDPPDEACIAMAQSLVSAGAASRLVAKLGASRDESRRAELVLVCRRVGHEMALAVADALSDTPDRFARRTFLDCMVAMGEVGMPVVQEMAEDSRWFVARNAVAILGEVGGDKAVELITGTLAHKDARVRREALMALAKVGGEDAGQLVYGMLEDSDADVRFAAAMAAGALKVDKALRPLLALMEDEEDDDVLVSILRALGQLGDPGAVAAIEKRAATTFFSRTPSEVRIAAYRALHNIGTPHAKEVLEGAVDDKDPEVRGAVRRLMEAK